VVYLKEPNSCGQPGKLRETCLDSRNPFEIWEHIMRPIFLRCVSLRGDSNMLQIPSSYNFSSITSKSRTVAMFAA
jgi:hypothetical protein